MALFWVQNAAFPTTAAPVKMATSAAIRTLLQVATSSTQDLEVVEWGISFDGSAAATPVECELVVTGAVGMTSPTSVTPQKYSGDAQIASGCTAAFNNVGTTTEGTVSTTTYGDLQLVPPTGGYLKQWPLGREFYVPISSFLRVRVTAPATVNAYAYVIWQE
jgi:hypothetical protein